MCPCDDDLRGVLANQSMSAAPQKTPGASARRVLVCTPFTPRLDARHGGKATAQLLRQLAGRNDIALLCLRATGEDPVDPAIAEQCAVVEEIPTRPNGFIPRRVAWGAGMLVGLPPWALDCRSPAFSAAFERLVDRWRPEVVEFHLQVMAQYVRHLKGRRVPTVLIDYDPPSAWAEDMVKTTRGLSRVARRFEVNAWRRYERSTRPRFDAIAVFAESDLADVRPTAGNASLRTIPLAVDVPAKPLSAQGADPPTILFVGAFAHHPNVDSALWLGREIFPRVHERVPEARLDIVGHQPGEEVRALAGGPIAIHGSVPDVTPYLDRAAVVVAPIRFGGSMRMKVLEPLAGGKAVVATPRAAEGVDATPGEHYILAADEEELVEALVGLLLDPERRTALGASARRWAEQNLGWEKGVEAFEELYDSLIDATNR